MNFIFENYSLANKVSEPEKKYAFSAISVTKIVQILAHYMTEKILASK